MDRIKQWMRNMVYLTVYALMAPLIFYKRIVRGRPLGVFGERFLGLTPRIDKQQHCILLHAVSVGEVNLLATLLDQLKQKHPDSRLVISTTTATGLKLAREKYPDTRSFYFPIDFSWAIRNLLQRTAPDAIVLTELELWPNLIAIANRQDVPVCVINGRLSEKSFSGYRRARRWLHSTFQAIDLVVAQNEEYASRFRELGCAAERVRVAGSIKFDGALSAIDQALQKRLTNLLPVQEHQRLWVAGSTQDPEETLVARIWASIKTRHPDLRLVIVPRHPERGPAILRNLSSLSIPARLQSSMNGESVGPDELLIADTIGQLREWWSLSSIAFVGGSFGNRGGQNMIEPAAFGSAVCFGPNTWNFRQTVRLFLENHVATEVSSEQELETFLLRCLNDPSFAESRGRSAQQLVAASVGAVDETCQLLERYFPSSEMKSAICRAKAA